MRQEAREAASQAGKLGGRGGGPGEEGGESGRQRQERAEERGQRSARAEVGIGKSAREERVKRLPEEIGRGQRRGRAGVRGEWLQVLGGREAAE